MFFGEVAVPLEIITYPASILLRPSVPVANIDGDLQQRVDRMIEALYASSGLGLAAPQVGDASRFFVYDLLTRDGTHPQKRQGAMVVINPEIIAMEGEEIGEEGCLSIPGYFEKIKRATRVQLKGLDREGREIRLEAEGLMARLFQHEMDHLNGLLMINRLSALKRDIFVRKFAKQQREENKPQP